MTFRAWGPLLFWAGPLTIVAGSAYTAWRFREHRERGGAPKAVLRRMQRRVLAAVAVPWLALVLVAWRMPGALSEGEEQIGLALVILANVDLVVWLAATTVVVAVLGREP